MGARGFQPDENVSPMGGLSMANKKWRHKRGVSSYKDWLFYESILQSLQTIKIQHLGKGLMAKRESFFWVSNLYFKNHPEILVKVLV